MSAPVKIPADVEVPDKILAGFTAAQVAILAATAAVLYAGWLALGSVLPLPVYAVLAAPVGVAGVALAVGRRDGVGAAELARAAFSYRLAPRRMSGAPATVGAPVPGWLAGRASGAGIQGSGSGAAPLRLPARAIGAAGYGPAGVAVIELGKDGLAVVAAASTVNFGLRTDAEQQALVGCFARLLHAVAGPVQILIRAQPLDLGPTLSELAVATAALPHPALRAAATDHYRYLAELAEHGDLLARQVLIVLREPTGASTGRPNTASAAARLSQRLGEVHRCLAPAEITITPLSPAAAEAVLATACDPDRPLSAASADMAAPGHVITTPAAGWSSSRRAAGRPRAGAPTAPNTASSHPASPHAASPHTAGGRWAS